MELKIKKTPTHTLKGEQVDTYVDILTRLVQGGRVNKFFPAPEEFCNLISFYKSSNNVGLYDELQINRDTGLPTEKEISRVITDQQVASKNIPREKEGELVKRYQQSPSDVNKRRLDTFYYGRNLLSKPILKTFNLELKLRSLDTDQYIAYFNAVLERFDLAEGLFARYTMVVGQEDTHWTSAQVEVVGDDLKYTQNFRNILAKYTSNEAEFAFILLNDLEKVAVEEVVRCRIGPLYFRGVHIPEGMEELFEKHPSAFILSFPTDKASIYIKEDKNNDPLVKMYRDCLDPSARHLRDQKAEGMGYKVFKERKFVCTRDVLTDFRALLKKMGARCVVNGI